MGWGESMTDATNLRITLDGDGTFTVEGPRGVFRLAYRNDDGACHWRATSPRRLSSDAQLLGVAPNLDAALILLAGAAGVSAKIVIALPCGATFSRPGRVPAEDVLAAYGYTVVSGIVGYAQVKPHQKWSERRLRELIVRRAEAAALKLINLDRVETEGKPVWQIRFVYPFAGPVRGDVAAAIVREAINDCGYTPIDRFEYDIPRRTAPNVAQIFAFQPMPTIAAA